MKFYLSYGVFVPAAILFLNACHDELDFHSEMKEYNTFVVSVEGTPTKVHLENESEVKWDVGDQIAVFSDVQGPSIFTRDSDGKFRGKSIKGNVFYSYPVYYNDFGGNLIGYNENDPMVLNYENSCGFFNTANTPIPFVAKSDDNKLSFKQTGGILHFRMKGSHRLSGVDLRGNNREHLCGPAYLPLEADPLNIILSENALQINMPTSCPKDICDSGCWDLYFYLPPLSFLKGFSLSITCINNNTGERFEVSKVSNRPLNIARGEMYSFPLFDIDSEYEREEIELAHERELLMSLYNATDGDNWNNNSNWCSDMPVSSWYGIETAAGNHVTTINLGVNHLCGALPLEVWSLPYLETIKLHNNRLIIKLPEDESQVSSSIRIIDVGNYDLVGVAGENAHYVDDRDNVLVDGIPASIKKLNNLSTFRAHCTNLTGTIPDEFWMPSLETVWLQNNNIEGELSEAVANATGLMELSLHNNSLSGAIPEEICELENLRIIDLANDSVANSYNHFTKLPNNLGKLKNLVTLDLYGNELRGNLPLSLFDCTNLRQLNLSSTYNLNNYYNCFDCELPDELGNLINLEYLSLFSTGIKGSIPESFTKLKKLSYCDLTGEYDLVRYASPNMLSGPLPVISGLEELQKLLLSNNYIEGNIPEHYADISGLSLQALYNCLSGNIPEKILQSNNFSNWSISPQRDGYGLSTDALYESKDYTRDGNVIPIQDASKGNGINIVIMGDAFADYQIIDGTYDKAMRKAIEHFFSIEPYSSYRDYFTVREVEVVSKNNVYLGSFQDTALETHFGDGTTINGNNSKCLDYASLAFDPNKVAGDELLVIVLLNREYYAGTCYMYHALEHDNLGVDYGNGPSIAYLPLGTDEDMFRGLIQHEAGGHGFAKLDDEYFYDYGGFFDRSWYDSVVALNWYPNIDVTSNHDVIKWKAFLDDSRYNEEGLGIFEGGSTVPTGIWRPTENSIMRYNNGEYNAPSREAIWKRIHKLSYGAEWEFSHESFVNYDQNIRMKNIPANKTSRLQLSPLRHYHPLPPPVTIEVSRDYIRNKMINYRDLRHNNKNNDHKLKNATEYTYTSGNAIHIVDGSLSKTITVVQKDNL